MTIHEIKELKEQKVSELLKTCRVFFAFSNEQYEKNKTPLEEGEKYVRIMGGGFVPQRQLPILTQGFKDIDKWYKKTVKENKQRKANIEYELANHEAYYTGRIDETLEALGEEYTREEVQAVYNATRAAHQD